MTPIAYMTSMCSHGAVVITASSDKYADGLGVARLTDLVYCPQHGTNPIITITIIQQTDSLTTANVTAIAQCGAVILTGSSDMYIG
jgi:uncharacterized Zn-binding protein involved in type VI secretion